MNIKITTNFFTPTIQFGIGQGGHGNVLFGHHLGFMGSSLLISHKSGLGDGLGLIGVETKV